MTPRRTEPPPFAGFRALGALRRSRGLIALVAAAMLIETAGGLAGPWMVREIVQRIRLSEADLASGVAWIGALLAAVYVVRAAASFATFHYSHVVAFRFCHDVRRRLFAHLHRFPPAWFDDRPSGDVVARVAKDTSGLEPMIADAIYGFAVSALIATGVVAILVALDPALALAAFAPLPFALAFVLWSGRDVRKVFDREADAFGTMSAMIQDRVGGMRDIQRFGRERQSIAAVARQSRWLARRQIIGRTLLARFDPSVDLATGLSITLVVTIGAGRVASGVLTIEDLVAFLLYIGAFYMPVYMMVGTLENVQSGLAGLRRIEGVLATEPAIRDRPGLVDPGPLQGTIQFDAVRFSYLPGRPVLDAIELKIPAGRSLALVGPTGAGKSTIAALLTRFHDPESGAIRIDGHDLRDLPLSRLRASIAQVSQDVFLFDATVRENLRFGAPDASDEEIEAACRSAEADAFIRASPEGYGTLIGERGVKLSGGQKQRLSIARAILKDAPILILDEATSSVDAGTEARIQRALERLSRGRTTIVIAHRLSTVRKADEIAVIEAGRIVEQGAHAALLARGGVYARLVSASGEAELRPLS